MKQKAKEKRLLQIVDILKKENKISTSRLAELLHVSEMTVRRDLDLLQKDHIVERKYGGAILERSLDAYEAGGEIYDLRRARVINVNEKSGSPSMQHR